MQILVVDDESLARSRLIRLIEDIPGCEVCGEADNGDVVLERIRECDPDLILLDVRMPGQDGIAVAKAIEQIEDPPAIVFCTAFDEYALEAFDTLAQGYIVKPVQLDQLQQVIDKTKKLTRAQSRVAFNSRSLSDNTRTDDQTLPSRKHVTVKTRKGLELIPLVDVYCFVADQKYVTVVHVGGETIVDDTLKELEQEFSQSFFRVHRNALVAIEKVEALEKSQEGKSQLRLKGSSYMPQVSRRHLQYVKEVLSQL